MKIPIINTITYLLLLGGALQGEDIDSVDMHGNSLLHSAAVEGRTKDAVRLIVAGADVNAKNRGGQTPLHLAAWNLELETSKLLIDHGVGVNIKDGIGHTALFVAARSGGLELVKLLVASGAEIPKSGLTPLNEAAGGMNMGTGKNPIRREELVKYFLDKGVDVNSKGSSAFAFGNAGVTPLHAAAGRSGQGVVSLLISSGADLEAEDHLSGTPLFHAARGGNSEAADVLLKKGAKVNARDTFGSTPLHVAVTENNVGKFNSEVVKLLLEAGADVDARDRRGDTPLYCAIAGGWGDLETLRMLLDAGAVRRLVCFDVASKNDDILRKPLGDRRSADDRFKVEIEISVFHWRMCSDSRRRIHPGIALLRCGSSDRMALVLPLDRIATRFGSLCHFSHYTHDEG